MAAEVIASVLADTVPGLVRRARTAAMSGADWIELRIDTLPAATDPREVLARIRLPVLVACRTPRDGGRFRGGPDERRKILQRWVDAGVQGLDLEAWESFVPDGVDRLRLMIRSWHNLSGVDPNLPAIRDQLLRMGANLAKIAVTAHDLADAAPVLDLMGGTDQSSQPTVAFAMGEDAWVTRVLACVYGAPYAYGSVGPGESTAPGQVPVQWLTGLFDVRRVTGSTMIYGVLGNPAGHSWGPWLFNRAFRLLAHDGIYLPFTTTHPEATVRMLSRRRLRGLSVTAPHKTALLRSCHEVDQDTELTGALNTLVFGAHGAIRGHNTDVFGVAEALAGAGFIATGANAVVLGGGGAARAAALALARLGLTPVLMPRSLDTARDFAREHGFRLARPDPAVLAELAPLALVNATPVGGPAERGNGAGSNGDGNGSSPAEAGAGTLGRLAPGFEIVPETFVLDMIYQVQDTELLREVRARGGVAVPGLAMFLAQAGEQLYLFTGRRLPRSVLEGFVGRR